MAKKGRKMHPDNQAQMQINMDLVARWSGYRVPQGNDAGEEPLAMCPDCEEEVPISELKADGCCDSCFIKQDAKRIEEDNNKWLKENENGIKS